MKGGSVADLSFDNLSFNYDRISAQDMWDFESKSGGVNLQEFAGRFERGEINESNFFEHMREIIAFLWIIVRQNNPGVTFEDVAGHPLVPLMNSIEPVKAAPKRTNKKAPAKVA